MPLRHPVLRNILNRRIAELQLMIHGIPAEEVRELSDWEIHRDLTLVNYIMEKTYRG